MFRIKAQHFLCCHFLSCVKMWSRYLHSEVFNKLHQLQSSRICLFVHVEDEKRAQSSFWLQMIRLINKPCSTSKAPRSPCTFHDHPPPKTREKVKIHLEDKADIGPTIDTVYIHLHFWCKTWNLDICYDWFYFALVAKIWHSDIRESDFPAKNCSFKVRMLNVQQKMQINAINDRFKCIKELVDLFAV